MTEPYIKKLEDIGEFEVWEVDGMHVRNHINREFTNFGQHFRFPFIPKHQFWIDKENSPGETVFFVDHMIVEWNLMNRGISYEDAITKADQRERLERKKSALLKKVLSENGHSGKKIPRELYTQKLLDRDHLQIWVVNGELVRDIFYIEYTEGGHHFVYNFVPLTEVWLDNDVTPQERDFVLLHELHERYLMYKGMDYNHAHNSSSYIEYQCRHQPSLLKKCLMEEFKKNDSIQPEFVSQIAM